MQNTLNQQTADWTNGSSIVHVPVSESESQIEVELESGEMIDISAFTTDQLRQLQCEQEPAFAKAIVAAPMGSAKRKDVTGTAYATVCKILELMTARQASTDFVMGLDRRYTDLIVRLLWQQSAAGVNGGLFELGFSSGVLLQHIAEQGFEVGGLEVVEGLIQQAKQKLPEQYHNRLLLGDFRQVDLSSHIGRYSVVYWNDVFEHIPTDEILEYLRIARSLLTQGGKLVTITPNWHMRPSDVTIEFCPPRTEAIGFHLKEYTLGETRALLLEAGFRNVNVPSLISKDRIYFSPALSFTKLKTLAEPLLEWLPYSAAVQCCRRFGFNCTVATK